MRDALLLFGFFITPHLASAATIVPDIYSGGYFTGDVVWTKADSPYVVTSAIFSGSSSLTIEPGAIIKFNTGYGIFVYGKLKVGSATSTEKVYLTSIKDDAVGGDTNNDAMSTLPRAGDWSGFNFAGTNGLVGSIDNAVFRYGGSGGTSAGQLIVFGGKLSLSHVQIVDSNNPAIRQSAGTLSIIDSDISNRCGGIRSFGGMLSITKSNLAIDYSLSSGQCSIFASSRYAIDNRATAFISAMDNWWGSPSGPQHPSNQSGTGSAISGNVDFTPWLTSDPFATTTCTQNCFSNILFLPGLEASRLYAKDDPDCLIVNCENQLWEPNGDADVEKLFLNSDGTSVRNDVYTRDVIDEKNVLPIGQGNIYESFISQMNDLKTAGTITDWEAAPYDWRLSLEDILNNGIKTGENISYLTATSSPYIIQEIRRLAETSKTGKVTIVAHSNGGLVAKALMQKLGDAETAKLIDKVILIAVPQVGTPQAIGAILHGYDQGLPFDSFPLILTPEIARVLAKNMPSAYNLLPSEGYFTSVALPVVTFDNSDFLADFRARYGTAIHSSTGLRNFITDTWRTASSTIDDLIYPSVGNANLLSQSEVVHSTLDSWSPPQGIQLYEIAGWGEDTLATIEYKEGKKTICNRVEQSFPFTGSHCVYTVIPTIEYTPREVVDGDGTVVTPSALRSTASTAKKYWVDLGDYNTFLFGLAQPNLFRTKHADILEVPSLRTFVQSILINSSIVTLPEFISSSTPPTDSTDRLSFILHSPLDLSATDNFGNVVNSATATIPGSSFTRYGEVQVLKVPKGTPIILNLTGYASGSFTLDMQEIDGLNNIIASSTIQAVPSATSTTATMSFIAGTLETATPLIVDYDGNGTTDFTITTRPREVATFDTTPPEARISFSTTTKQLLIEGLDGSSITIQTSATSTIITDQTGNTLGILFKKLKQEKHELKLEIQGFYYNGVSTSTIQKTALQYEWSTDKQGNLRELEQKATVGALKIEAHYDAKKNVTISEKKVMENEGDINGKEIKEVLLGLVIIGIKTEKGIITINY